MIENKLCLCGCGKVVNPGRNYIHTHGRRAKLKPKLKLICLNCGEEIILPPWKITQKFCSNKCKYDYKLNRQSIAQKRKETFIRKYGGFDLEKIHGTEGLKDLKQTFSESQVLRHSNMSSEQKNDISTKISKGLTGHIVTKETRAKLVKANLNRSKEVLDKIIRNSLKACCARPNKFETRALAYINIIYPNKFIYTGNGTMIVNHKSADAYSKELNTVALFHGYYWHLKRFGLEITDENKRGAEKVDAAPFLSEGYKVIFIWEDELNSLVEALT